MVARQWKKLLEIAYWTMHMERHNLFTTHQHGFRKGRSCVTQLIKVLDDWTEQLDNRNAIDTIYLDFQKAFDTVPHKRLINKLQRNPTCHCCPVRVCTIYNNFLFSVCQKVSDPP
jgi:hypothetical protein